MKVLNFALIGRGKWGKNYERLLKEIPGVSLQAVVDFSSGNLKTVLKNPDIHCAIIATPPKTHFPIAKIALKAGKHILLEKPMAVNLKEAEKLKKIVENLDRVLMVGFQYLFNGYVQYLKKEIENGAFGEIKNISSEHFQSPLRTDVNAFWDAAPHPLSIFQFIFNPKKIIKVSVEQKNLENSGLENYVKAAVQFDRGPLLNIAVSWPGKEKVRKFTIQGKKQTAVLDETKTAEKLTLISNKEGKITIPRVIAGEPLKNEVKHFIDCVQNRKTPLTGVNFGYLNTQWLEMINLKISS